MPDSCTVLPIVSVRLLFLLCVRSHTRTLSFGFFFFHPSHISTHAQTKITSKQTLYAANQTFFGGVQNNWMQLLCIGHRHESIKKSVSFSMLCSEFWVVLPIFRENFTEHRSKNHRASTASGKTKPKNVKQLAARSNIKCGTQTQANIVCAACWWK